MPALRKRPEQIREESITKAFRKALIDKGWTQAHLAELIGCKPPWIHEIITKPMQKPLRNVLAVADKLGVDILANIR